MEETLIYLLKSAALLSIFLIGYQLLLKNDTSFHLNRRFLFWGILAALVLPAVEFTRTVYVEATSVPVNLAVANNSEYIPPALAESINWWEIAGTIYALGFAVLLIRFLVQLFSVMKIVSTGKQEKVGRFVFTTTEKQITPFSFFNIIVFNPQLHTQEELKIILEHEKVHASQWHSVDVLLVNLAAAVLWFNPLVWWYKKSLTQNLEFIADKETVATSVPKKEYQQTLVKISVAEFQPALANSFYQSFIKKRIIMMNKKPSNNSPFWKISLIVPLILGFMFFFNIKTEAQVVTKTSESNLTSYPQYEIRTTITKNTKKETLDQIKNMFKREGVDLTFDPVEYSNNGLITRIKVSFEKQDSGQTGDLDLQNKNGIGDFMIALNDEGFTISPLSISDSAGNNGEEHRNILMKIGKSPLYIINGKEYRASDLAGKVIDYKGNLSVLSKKEARAKFGRKAKDGAIFIEEGKILDDMAETLKKIDTERKNIKRNYISITKGEKPTLSSLETNFKEPENSSQKLIPDPQDINASEYSNENVSIMTSGPDKVLIILDGKKMPPSYKFQALDPEDIKSIEVLKGHNAIEKYGQKGKNGVFLISTNEEHKNTSEDKGQKKKVTYIAQKVKFSETSDKKGSSIRIIDVSKIDFDKEDSRLYVLNGKIMGKDFNPEEMDHEKIESIQILKGEIATEKYGDKAINGAVEIKTKEKE